MLNLVLNILLTVNLLAIIYSSFEFKSISVVDLFVCTTLYLITTNLYSND